MPLVYRIGIKYLICLGTLTLACTGTVAYAQEGGVGVRVTYVAGQHVYLDAGRDQGILPTDTLGVYQDGTLVGRLVVISSIADRSVVTFADDAFPVAVGMRLQLRMPATPEGEPPGALSPTEAEVQPTPPVAPPKHDEADRVSSTTQRRRSGTRPSITGRVILSLNTLQSNTKWRTGRPGDARRVFVTPSVNLHATVRGLPQGLRLRTRLRSDYRYSSRRAVEPEVSIRAYEVLLEKDFSPFSIQAGRFSNRYASYGGYWDGVLLHYGSKQTGIGTAIGFMPDRSNEGFSSDMPRYAGFAHFEVGDRSSLKYAAKLSFNEIRPTNHLLNHRFAGLSQNLRWGGLYLRNDVQLDRNPETGRWIASRFVVRGGARPLGWVSLHGRYTIRQPYSIYRTQRVISYRRDQAGVGVSLHVAGTTLGADVTLNFVDLGAGGHVNDGRTISGYFQVPKTGVLDLGLSTTASYWSTDEGSSFFLNTGVVRRIGPARMRLQYQFYRTATFAAPLLTNAVTLNAVVPLAHGFYTRSQVRLQQSTTLSSMALYTSLWVNF